MEKFLYFRATSGVSGDQDETSGSVMYPVSSIKAPFTTIINNGGILGTKFKADEGVGINVLTGKKINMIDAGIVDPVLVTKSALKNAVSVATTIMSADCVISNIRVNESS